MEWEEAVIWVLVMLPSVIPRGSSHDPSTEKKQTNKQTKTKTKQERESQEAQSKHFFVKGG